MTIEQKRKVLQRIVDVEHDIDELKKCRLEIAVNGYASATLASSGGSKSYTRLSLNDLAITINQLVSELKSLRSLLTGSSTALPSTILTVYS